jgi:hypothetical protein
MAIAKFVRGSTCQPFPRWNTFVVVRCGTCQPFHTGQLRVYGGAIPEMPRCGCLARRKGRGLGLSGGRQLAEPHEPQESAEKRGPWSPPSYLSPPWAPFSLLTAWDGE